MKTDRYISVNELKRQLNAWNMGLELPRWIIRAIDETPSAKVIIAEEGAKNGKINVNYNSLGRYSFLRYSMYCSGGGCFYNFLLFF